MINLPKSIYKFAIWWFVGAPKKLHIVLKRIAYLVNNESSFTLNIRLLFVPLYGDYSIVGRFIGFILRVTFIVFGFAFVVSVFIAAFLAPLAWYILMFAAVYYLDFWLIPIIASLYLYITYLNLDTPDKKVSQIGIGNNIDAFRPRSKHFLKKVESGGAHAIESLLSQKEIIRVLQKAELDNHEFKDNLKRLNTVDHSKIQNFAFTYAEEHKTRYVELEHILLALLKTVPNIDSLLSKYEVEFKTLEESVDWIVDEYENLSRAFFWQDGYEMHNLTGFGHGLTGRVTPDLDAISQDFTKLAKKRRLRTVVGRENEIEQISQFLGGSNENVLLLGEPGCGKTSIVRGLAHLIMHGTKHASLKNKRLVSLEMGSLIAGTHSQGAMAGKLKKAMDDVVASGDIILFIDEIHTLVESVNESEGFSTVFSILEPYLSSGEVRFVAATTMENYRKYLEPMGSFSRLFEIVEIPESSPEDTLKILKHVAKKAQIKLDVEITMPALLTIIQLSEKMIHDRVLPDKAIDVLNRASAKAKDKGTPVDKKVIREEISQMTHIPVTAVSQDESEKLLMIEETLKQRVIGQDHAITKVSNAVKRARVGVRNEKKPIASFLFVGTTGVGKTETAKALSETYFESEGSMIRLDMSEYQSPDSIDKLIGTSDARTKGVLTEAIRTKPFTVVLLDEIEKAHHQIILAFLQVLDEGRLTDSTGHTVNFTNTIIIATSNTGTKEIQNMTEQGKGFEEIEETAMKAVRGHFAPELLNRFTAIVVYKSLDKESIKKIAHILLDKVRERTQENNKIKIGFTQELVEKIATNGYNPEWGARPMARLIEEAVETHLANKILAKEIEQGDVVELGVEIFD